MNLLADIERVCRQHSIAKSRFGRDACRDPRLVDDLRRGRTPSTATEAAIREHIERLTAL